MTAHRHPREHAGRRAGSRLLHVVVLLAALLVPAPARACIWDSDTLADELRGVPDAHVLLVTDRWHRHGEAYYRNRVVTLPKRLEEHPADLAAYDDLAVAIERLGDPDAAIAVMDRKLAALERHPDADHLYRAYANRGTFHSHAGRYAQALADLEKAVALNPAAHFGRERFQIEAIRYAMAVQADATLRTECSLYEWIRNPHARKDASTAGDASGRADPGLADAPLEEFERALSGILRFGGREGAEIYRALGELHHDNRNLHMAWWAFHRAIDRGHPAEAELRAKIGRIEEHWRKAGLLFPPSGADFAAMKANGAEWRRSFDVAEAEALARGRDPGDEGVLRELLAEATRRTPGPPSVGHFDARALAGEDVKPKITLAVVVIAGIGGSLLVVWDNRRRRRRAAASTPAAPPPA